MRNYCAHTTRNGAPCRARPLKGTDTCLAHSTLENRESVGWVARNGKAGRKPKPTAEQFLAAWFAEHEPELLRVLTDALAAMRAVAVGAGPSARIELAPDHDVRLRALKETLDRIYGRPKQAQEITGAEGGPVLLTAGGQDLSRLSVGELGELRGLLSKADTNGHADGDGGGP